MTNKRLFIFFLIFLTNGFVLSAQKIIYSEPDRDDSRRMTFEIIGKLNGNFLVYKNIRNRNWVALYDNDMNLVNKVEEDFLPTDRLINIDFFSYTDYFYMIYQYQRKNAVYCMAVKMDPQANKMSDPVQLDSTHIGFAANNKIYSVISSEDKNKIMVFKINSRNRERYVLTTLLHDVNLQLIKKSVNVLPMEDRNEYLDEFNVDNDGDFVFTKFYRQNNDMVTRGAFIIKPALDDTLTKKELAIDKSYLDEIHIKIDNYNKRYLLTSFYYTENRGNVEGLYYYVWDKKNAAAVIENKATFSDALRKDARGEASMRTAFNDYFIRNIIIKRDGGFIIGSEAFYTTSRYNAWNRWDYLFSPYYSPYDYYYYSPYYNSLWYRSRFYGNNNQNVRYHADNMVIFSFDKEGNLQWNNVISKSQFDDESDDLISYQVVNTGGLLHFLFNVEERRVNLLNDYTISPSGDVNRNPTLKNLDKGYDFMAKYGKQVSGHQIIVPCIYRNNICFAKIEYN